MTASEFIERANYGERLTAGWHWNAAYFGRLRRGAAKWECKRHGFWHQCAPAGAAAMQPAGLPEHGPAICALGAYAG